MIFSKEHTEAHNGLVHFLKGYPMVGIGPSARGYLGRFNYRNVCDVKKYIELIHEKKMPVENGCLVSETLANERAVVFFPILLRIRQNDIKYYSKYEEKFEILIKQNLITINNGIIELTNDGIIWAGNIQHFLSDDEELAKDRKGFVSAILDNTNPYNQDRMGVKK